MKRLTAIDRVRGEIDELFAQRRPLGEILEDSPPPSSPRRSRRAAIVS